MEYFEYLVGLSLYEAPRIIAGKLRPPPTWIAVETEAEPELRERFIRRDAIVAIDYVREHRRPEED